MTEPYNTLLGEAIRQITPASAACRLACTAHCRHEQDNIKRSDEANNIIPTLRRRFYTSMYLFYGP